MGLLALAVLLGGCSFAEDKDRGERAVGHVHDLFVAANDAEIYAHTTPDFREAASEAEFVNFLDPAQARAVA